MSTSLQDKPSVFTFSKPHDYLKARVEHDQATSQLTPEKIQSITGLSSTQLAGFLSGERTYSEESLANLYKYLNFSPREQSYFQFLVANNQGNDVFYRMARPEDSYRFHKSIFVDQVLLHLIAIAEDQFDMNWYEKFTKQFINSHEAYEGIRRLIEHGHLIEKEGRLTMGKPIKQYLKAKEADECGRAQSEFQRVNQSPGKRHYLSNIFTLRENDLEDFIVDFLKLAKKYTDRANDADSQSLTACSMALKNITTFKSRQ